MRLIERASATDVSNDDGKLIGRAIVYGVSTTLWDGSYAKITEEISAGCIENMGDKSIAACINHHPSELLARMKSNSLSLIDKSDGLYCEIMPNTKTRAGNDAMEYVARGDIYGMSFRARVTEETRKEKALKGGKIHVHYTVNKMKLRELGPVTFPQYTETNIKARNDMTAYDIARDELCRMEEKKMMEMLLNRARAEMDMDIDLMKFRARQNA